MRIHICLYSFVIILKDYKIKNSNRRALNIAYKRLYFSDLKELLTYFNGTVLKGDIEGWRKGITLGATHLGLLTAKIAEGNIEVSDGRVYALSDCKVELY